jgi:hypothetical protein
MSDILAFIAIVVSLGTALATLYLQFLQPRHAAVALGDEMYLNYGEAGQQGGYAGVGAVISISLVNSGARDALVTMMTATFSQDSANFQTTARWLTFFDPVDAGTPGKSSTPSWKFDGMVRPLAATSRKVVTQWIYFSSATPISELPIGDYTLDLEIIETRPSRGWWREASADTDRRPLAHWAGAFSIDQDASDTLKSSCVLVNGWTDNSFPIELRRRQSPIRRRSGSAIIPR